MSEPEEKEQQELATNRLLELLRAQQAGETVGEEPVVQEETPRKKPRAVEGITVPDLDTEPEKEIVQTTGAESASKSLLDSLAKIGTEEEPATPVPEPEPAPTEVEEPVAQLIPEPESKAEPAPPPEKPSTPEPEPESIPTDILQQIKLQTVPDAEEEVVVEPVEFDHSLFSEMSETGEKPAYTHYLEAFFRHLNESNHRISFFFGENCIRYVQIKTGITSILVEKAKTYQLPLGTTDHIINDFDELLAYILENELDPKYRRSLYGAVYSPKINSRTRIFQTPKVKKSELADLVEWNVKKNIPFKPDQAAINWETAAALGDSSKQNVVVGIVEKEPLIATINQFREYKVKLRLFSTLPILLWKSFIRNYPDRKEGCYALIHMGESLTTVAVVSDQRLVFSREIVLGAQDFYRAVMQRVVVGDRTIEIDAPMAEKILQDYGLPENTKGVIPQSGISLYKISIFLRPIIERLNNELSRSMNYFKKQNPDLNWEMMLFTGRGATIPNLLPTINKQMDIEVELLNPLRFGKYEFADEAIIPDNELPNYAMNFALLADETERINILPKGILASYRYIFLSKLAATLVAFLIPFYGTSYLFSNYKISSLANEVKTKKSQWDRLSSQSKEYFDLITDIEILGGFEKLLKNDRVYSENQIKILKILSSTAGKDIKLTSLAFKKEVIDEKVNQIDNPGTYVDVLDISGFVKSDPSIADIQLTNFAIKLEQTRVFKKVKKDVQETSDTQDWKLFFTFRLWW